MSAAIRDVIPGLDKDEFTDVAVSYLAAICCTLMNLKQSSDDEWADVEKYMSLLSKNVPGGAFSSLKAKCSEMMKVEEIVDDDEDAEELCNCQFTLAYGELVVGRLALVKDDPGMKNVERNSQYSSILLIAEALHDGYVIVTD